MTISDGVTTLNRCCITKESVQIVWRPNTSIYVLKQMKNVGSKVRENVFIPLGNGLLKPTAPLLHLTFILYE